MEAFEISDLIQQRAQSNKLYHEFLRAPSLSCGIYALPAGGADPQQPHHEDEVYYVVSGHAKMTIGDEERAVQAGSIIYVKAHVPHRFHSISADMQILVVFAPAEATK